MRIFSDADTHRLEEYAKQIGVNCQIRKIEAREEGRYFVVMMDDEPLKWPVALGFTLDQAEHAIKRRSWERYAVRADSRKLDSGPPPPMSHRRSKKKRFPW